LETGSCYETCGRAFISRDFLRSAVAFLMTPTLAALSITETADLRACSRSSAGALCTFLTAVAILDLMDRFLAFCFSFCLSLLIADFFCGNITSMRSIGAPTLLPAAGPITH
jgi:hypothetical protein